VEPQALQGQIALAAQVHVQVLSGQESLLNLSGSPFKLTRLRWPDNWSDGGELKGHKKQMGKQQEGSLLVESRRAIMV